MNVFLYFPLVILTTFLTAIVYLVIYFKWKYSYWQRKGVIQLKPEFFYGNTKGLVLNEKSWADTYDEIYQQFKMRKVKYGGAYVLNGNLFIALDPDLIKSIMLKDFDHFTSHFHEFKSPTLFRRGLFHLGGAEWRRTRKMLTPTFTSAKMKMMFDIVLDKATRLQQLAERITNQNNGPVDVRLMMERFTVDVIGSCGFGIECNSMENPDSTFLKYGKSVLEPVKGKEPVWSILLRMIFSKKVYLKDLEKTEQFFLNTVKTTIDYREKNQISRKDFLQLMIQLKNNGIVNDIDNGYVNNTNQINGIKNKYSIEDITAQCLIFFVAGFDTSANTVTFALLELSRKEEMQQRIRDEYDQILKKYGGKLTYEGILDLKYTECVIYETLRKYPAIAAIPRTCTKQYKLPNSDLIIEKGTDVIIPAWSMHNDPDYFSNPERFDPERFTDENKSNVREFTYFPFGEGPRMCLGYRFALMQTKLALATILSNFKITPNEKTAFPLKIQSGSFVSRPLGHAIVNFEKI